MQFVSLVKTGSLASKRVFGARRNSPQHRPTACIAEKSALVPEKNKEEKGFQDSVSIGNNRTVYMEQKAFLAIHGAMAKHITSVQYAKKIHKEILKKQSHLRGNPKLFGSVTSEMGLLMAMPSNQFGGD